MRRAVDEEEKKRTGKKPGSSYQKQSRHGKTRSGSTGLIKRRPSESNGLISKRNWLNWAQLAAVEPAFVGNWGKKVPRLIA
jgi:hypothetical protein